MKTYPRYWSLCFVMFLLACIVGMNFVLSGLPRNPSEPFWEIAKPHIGAFILLASMIMNFVGFTLLAQRTQPTESGNGLDVASTTTPPAP